MKSVKNLQSKAMLHVHVLWGSLSVGMQQLTCIALGWCTYSQSMKTVKNSQKTSKNFELCSICWVCMVQPFNYKSHSISPYRFSLSPSSLSLLPCSPPSFSLLPPLLLTLPLRTVCWDSGLSVSPQHRHSTVSHPSEWARPSSWWCRGMTSSDPAIITVHMSTLLKQHIHVNAGRGLETRLHVNALL